MHTRRQFIKIAGLAGTVLAVPGLHLVRRVVAQVAGGSLDPSGIPKYASPLVIPAAMPRTGIVSLPNDEAADYYQIAVRQFQQHILPSSLPATTVWSYGSVSHPGSLAYPACTIEAQHGRPVRVKWVNDLKDRVTGHYLPHLLPVDPTLHWANPPGGLAGRDTRPPFAATPGPYTGPIPTVPHLHGIERVAQESDGFPEAWFLPAASDIPTGYATTGTAYDAFKASSALGAMWGPGAAVFQYPNRQSATALWYHDHTLGLTRANVYAGPAGFYLLRGGDGDAVAEQLPGPAPKRGDRPGTKYYEIPLVIQDRSFNADGSLFYPDSREFFDGFTGPYSGDSGGSDIAPIWNPEVFANTMVVNGRTWPYLTVERRRYRFRLLNACNSRFLILKLGNGLPFWQIGADGGHLPAPVMCQELLLAPAERADVIVDFTQIPVGTQIILGNLGPDEPFGGGVPGVDFPVADPNTTGQVIQFRVVAATSVDRSTPPHRLRLPQFRPLGRRTNTRQVSLNEVDSAVLPGVGPQAALLGTVDAGGMGMPMMWDEAVTETPALGSTEVWEIFNYTEDAHPVHPHTVQFQVMNRQPFDGTSRPPEPGETGYKDIVIAYPGEITRIKARFNAPGRFVWHCHILEHEDNEMMRPLVVTGTVPPGDDNNDG